MCVTNFHNDLRAGLKTIPCSQCRCGHRNGNANYVCKDCPPSQGCTESVPGMDLLKIHSNCNQCEYGYRFIGDLHRGGENIYGCRPCCRTMVDGEVSCINCDLCPGGTVHGSLCKPEGCKCGVTRNWLKNVYECKYPCPCPCGECRYRKDGPVQCCHPCNCQCGTCLGAPGHAILLSPTGFTRRFCCPVCQGNTKVACFPSMARVSLENGKSVTMAELQVGDRVQAGEQIHYSMILVSYMFDLCLTSEQF